MIVNLVVVKRWGIAGVMISTCLGEKCVFGGFMGIWFVAKLGFQFFVR